MVKYRMPAGFSVGEGFVGFMPDGTKQTFWCRDEYEDYFYEALAVLTGKR